MNYVATAVILILIQTTCEATQLVKALQDTEKCGVPVISKQRIVGGSQTTAGEWPWQALFIRIHPFGASPFCGGTLLNTKWIVTAAHCTESLSSTNIHMILGEYDYRESSPHTKEYAVAGIFDHENYNARTWQNDISLLKLAGEVVYTDYIIPACLPTQGDDVTVGLKCWITGWGNTENNAESENILREAPVPILSNSICQSWYSSVFVTIYDVHMCAGYEYGTIDTCQGDSGGPLVCQSNSTSPFVLQGITSFGYGCAEIRKPGVYTRVSDYVSWIESTINSNSEKDSFFSITPTLCGTVVTSNSTLRLPVNSETQLYFPSMTCQWKIIPDKDSRYTIITFIEKFMVEEGYIESCSDYIEIIIPSGYATICEMLVSKSIVIDNNLEKSLDALSDYLILFESDLTSEREGFAIDIVFGNSTSGIDITDIQFRTTRSSGGKITWSCSLLLFMWLVVFYVIK